MIMQALAYAEKPHSNYITGFYKLFHAHAYGCPESDVAITVTIWYVLGRVVCSVHF